MLVNILIDLINMGKEALGCEVEIEFAANIFDDPNKKSQFALLQIKPMVMGGTREIINLEEKSDNEILCCSKVTLGDGLINDIRHIVFVNPKKFKAAITTTMALNPMPIIPLP